MSADRTKAGDDFPRVTTPVVGREYHLAWAWRGCRWTLKEVTADGQCRMMARVSGKRIVAKLDDLRETRRNEPATPAGEADHA